MDKETLAILLSVLSEIEIIDLYKYKKINNFGFRVNTTEDVRKNRQILESNLLKPINMKHVQRYFVFKAADSEIKIDGLEWNKLKELCEIKGYSNVLIALYVNGKKDEINKIISEYFKGLYESPSQSACKDEEVNNVSEIKSSKTIKKLETKLNNITEEFKKKENNYKLELENKNNLVIDLRKENSLLKQEVNRINKENNQQKLKIDSLTKENNKLLQKNGLYNDEIQSLIEEIELMKEELIQINDITQNSNQTAATTIYKIGVFGEVNDYILNEIEDIHFEFIEGDAIKKLSIGSDYNIYNEIWIVHYDLTQREKRYVQMMNLESNKEIIIKDIYSLKELNQAIFNLKK